MKNLDLIKEKLKKLIAKEASAREIGSLEEAEAFASKISTLLMEYELEIKDLEDKPEEIAVGHQDYNVDDITNRHESNWIAMLYNACSFPTFCKVIFLGPLTTTHIRIIGTPRNREFLHFMAAQLIVKLRELARLSWKNYSGTDKRNTFIRSFYKGACSALQSRLALDKFQKAKQDANVQGLVIQKDRLITQYIQSLGMALGKGKARKSASNDGYQQGHEAGSKVPINQGVGQGNKKTLLLN